MLGSSASDAIKPSLIALYCLHTCRGEIDEVEQAEDLKLALSFFYTQEAYSLVSTCARKES